MVPLTGSEVVWCVLRWDVVSPLRLLLLLLLLLIVEEKLKEEVLVKLLEEDMVVVVVVGEGLVGVWWGCCWFSSRIWRLGCLRWRCECCGIASASLSDAA